jgi:hypothetical protein
MGDERGPSGCVDTVLSKAHETLVGRGRELELIGSFLDRASTDGAAGSSTPFALAPYAPPRDYVPEPR